jgi:hypothetical protein
MTYDNWKTTDPADASAHEPEPSIDEMFCSECGAGTEEMVEFLRRKKEARERIPTLAGRSFEGLRAVDPGRGGTWDHYRSGGGKLETIGNLILP